MRAHLTSNGVDPRHLVDAAQPSTLAVVSFDEQRRASYDFWTDGTADWQWSDGDLAGAPRSRRRGLPHRLAGVVDPAR